MRCRHPAAVPVVSALGKRVPHRMLDPPLGRAGAERQRGGPGPGLVPQGFLLLGDVDVEHGARVRVLVPVEVPHVRDVDAVLPAGKDGEPEAVVVRQFDSQPPHPVGQRDVVLLAPGPEIVAGVDVCVRPIRWWRVSHASPDIKIVHRQWSFGAEVAHKDAAHGLDRRRLRPAGSSRRHGPDRSSTQSLDFQQQLPHNSLMLSAGRVGSALVCKNALADR